MENNLFQKKCTISIKHPSTKLLHPLANIKVSILLFCKHNKCKCSYFRTRVREWMSTFLTAHQHNQAIQCHSPGFTLEKSGQKTNKKYRQNRN